MNDIQPTRISDKLTTSITKLYRVGGLGLVFIFIGVITMTFAFLFPKGDLSTPIFAIGSILVLTSFILFMVVQFNGLIKTKKTLNNNKKAIDEIQDLSIALTKLTYTTQSYCFKNIEKLKGTVDSVLPILKPLLGEKGKKIAIKIEDVSSGIIEYSDTIEKVISQTKNALEQGDLKILETYKGQIDDLNKKLQLVLKNN